MAPGLSDPTSLPARYPRMDTPPLKPPSEMTDDEIRREWHCIDCETEDEARTEALARELERRNIDV
jgi:hypothetical protein